MEQEKNLNTKQEKSYRHKTSRKDEKAKSVLSYLHDVVYLLSGMLLVFLLLFRIVVVSGSSMENTLVNGDYVLLLNNIFYSEPKQGDVVVVSKSYFRDGEPIIKRVIATQGQTVTIKNGKVSVDGVALNETYLDDGVSTYATDGFEITVEEGHVFCLGDNRGVSKDSRSSEIGQVDCREILGKAILLFLPRQIDSNGLDFRRFGVVS